MISKGGVRGRNWSPGIPWSPWSQERPSLPCQHLFAQLSTPHGPGMTPQSSGRGGTGCPAGLVFAHHLALTTET